MAMSPSDGPGRALVYAGVDEAGYGPLLGPLCVGLAVLRLQSHEPGSGTPNVWKALRGVVCRRHKPGSTRWIAVDDSKRLKLANGSRTAHPLSLLERGVLSFAGQLERLSCDDDDALLATLGCGLAARPWYAGDPVPLPLATTPDHVRLLTSRLGASMSRAGVELLDLCCPTLCEESFNAGLRRAGTKARVSFDVVGRLARRVWLSEAVASSEEPARLVIDRQGGRTGYVEELERVLPGARIEPVERSGRASAYDVSGEVDGRARRMRVIFEVDAEARHFPVALASMTAKLVRELAMMRMNRYWGARIGEIKPTAGYTTDARRWLADARRLGVPEDELRLLCRDA